MKYKISVENLKPYGQRDMAYHGFGLAHGSTVGAASISNSSARAKGALGNSFFDTALLVCFRLMSCGADSGVHQFSTSATRRNSRCSSLNDHTLPARV